MGQTRSIIIGLALVLGQTAAAYAADLGLPAPEPECVGCSGPWYVKGFVGAANPNVGGIDYELITPDFVTYDKEIKSTPLFGVGFGYDTGHYFRFDLTGEYRGDALFVFHDKYPGAGWLLQLRFGCRHQRIHRRHRELARPRQRLYRSGHLVVHHALCRRRRRLRLAVHHRLQGRERAQWRRRLWPEQHARPISPGRSTRACPTR